jgi:hypothetical protein
VYKGIIDVPYININVLLKSNKLNTSNTTTELSGTALFGVVVKNLSCIFPYFDNILTSTDILRRCATKLDASMHQ